MRFLLKKPKTASRNTDDSVSNQLPPPYRSSPVSKPHPRYEFPPNFFAEAGLEGGENDLEILRDYDTVIIVDDSGSMGEHRCHSWNQAREAVAELAVIASMYDEDGIEIYFLNQVDTRKEEINPSRKFTSKEAVRDLFEFTPSGGTDIGKCLTRVANTLLEKLEREENRPKKISYLVITDGRPTDDLEGAIVSIARRLNDAGAVLSQIGIQFIQVGTNAEAKTYLEWLDNGLKEKYSIRDMVDTEPYTDGLINAAKLVKLLLGSINRKIDKLNGEGATSSK